MPGIIGIIGKGLQNAAALDSMLQCTVHESFYRTGKWSDEKLGCWIGWTTLPDAFNDCLPVWNEKRDVCLIFNGEDFADQQEIDALRAKGHVFASGNAEYLVHLYEELGPKFVEKLNGWFSGVVIDLREQKVLLFNDRYGASRLFFHQTKDTLYFASEAKALLKIVPELRHLDMQSLGEFLSTGSILQNRTLFSGLTMIPGGSLWTHSLGQPIRKESYFRKEQWESLPELDPETYYNRLKDVWARTLPRYFRGKGKVGLSLTGGVDSRMILGWIPSDQGEVPCYTWGGSYRDCKDVTISREIAAICGQKHQTIPVADEFLSQFPQLAEKAIYISDATMDVVGAIDVFVQRKARQLAPIRLGGVYGGEILRRLVMFKPVSTLRNDFLRPEVTQSIDNSFKTYQAELQGNRLSFTAFKQAPWHMTGKFSIEASQLIYRTPYFDNELVALSYQSPSVCTASNEVSLRLIADGNPALKSVATDRALALSKVPGLTQLMHAYQQFTFKAEYAYDYGMPQKLAKIDHVLAPLHLERLFLGRHKFHHFRTWYRDKLAGYVKDVLLDARTRSRPYLNATALESMVNAHTSGRANHTLEIHKMLAVELAQRQLIEMK